MPVIASTASVSGRPWSMHSERQVQNQVAWPMTGIAGDGRIQCAEHAIGGFLTLNRTYSEVAW